MAQGTNRPPAADLSSEQIAQRAFDLNLLTERQLQEVWGQFGSRNVEAADFKQALLRREFVTNWQLDRVLRGERGGYFYGQYKVQYLIGSGTFARVYRAVHKTTGQVMAIKALRRRFCEEPEQREKFRLEGEMGQSLRHPNIVPIFEVAAEGIQNYLVMEFLEGRNLREFIKIRKRFEPADATKLIADVTRGLDYAFQKGISHRDLKTSNVLVTSSGIAKLVDFGLAAADPNLSDESLAEMANPRTIDYAALERATGVRKDDSRSDIYFLGCIYYHMLTGVPALPETKDRIQRLSKSRFSEIAPIGRVAPDVPRAVTIICDKAMELNAKLRYQTPGAMLADVNLLLQRMAGGRIPDTLGNESGEPGVRYRQRSLMFVESNVPLQNLFRDKLKQAGFRVLVTSDAGRPQQSFTDQDKPADCVLFSTGDLEEEAFAAFNKFGEHKWTQKVPAILLLSDKHLDWRESAKLSENRAILRMPVKLKELCATLDRLVPPVKEK